MAYRKREPIPEEEVFATVFPWRSMKGVSVVPSPELIRKIKAGEKVRGILSLKSITRLVALIEKGNTKAYSKIRFSRMPRTTVDTHEDVEETTLEE